MSTVVDEDPTPGRRNLLFHFFFLAFAFTWCLLPLTDVSIAFSLVALCGPAIAATIVARREPPAQQTQFRVRLCRWRVDSKWYVIAFSIPLLASGLRCGLEYTWGARGSIQLQSVTVLSLIVFVLVAGEEIGWRGYALSKLIDKCGVATGTVLLGMIWALWHLPLFVMSNMPQFGMPFLAFIIYTIALSTILTYLFIHGGDSVPLATCFHGAVNTFGFVNTEATSVQRGWGNAICYGAVALSIVAYWWSCSRVDLTSK